MRTPFIRVAFAVCVQFCLASASVAADKAVEKPFMADTAAKFAETVKQVHEAMQPQGRYEFIRPEDRAKVDTDIQTMQAMLEKSGSVAAMSADEKVRLYNAQEHLNGILTHSDNDRLVCERRAPVGTNIPVINCRTFGEVERTRRDAQKYMVDHAKDAGVNAAAMHSKLGGGGG